MAEQMHRFEVDMTCNGCVNAVRNMLTKVPGVTRVEVDLAAKTAEVRGTAAVPDLQAALKKTGKKYTLIA